MVALVKNLVAFTVLAATVTAHAAAPGFNLVGASGVEYSGTTPMGETADETVYWFLEQQDVGYATASGVVQVDSWFVFYHPVDGRQSFSGSIGFDQPIVDVFVTQAGLQGSASFGKAGTTYDYAPRFIGLEQGDRNATSFAGGTISIGSWAAGDPGDHIRVLTVTAVPEPATYGLMLAGLAWVGFALRRRSRG